jgi:hypothetical protein
MNLRFIERDGKKILQQSVYRDDCIEQWKDVPCVEDKQNDAIPAVDPVWCEHLIWEPRTEHRQYDCWGYKETPTSYRQNVADKWTVCPICQAPRPSTKAQEVEKKEPRKMIDVLAESSKNCNYAIGDLYWKPIAVAAIAAVIECYWEWYNNTTKPLGKFPEYLKEKML